MAGSAFKDKDVVETLTHFTPILVDGDTEKDITKKYGANGFPTTVFADAKGEAVGKVVGAVDVKKFLSEAESAVKKAKKGKPSKAFKALLDASEDLKKALEKDNVKSAIAAAVKAIETGLDHALVADARAAHEKLMASGQAQLDAAAKQVESGDGEAARTVLRKLNIDYKGTPVGDGAKALLKQLADASEE